MDWISDSETLTNQVYLVLGSEVLLNLVDQIVGNEALYIRWNKYQVAKSGGPDSSNQVLVGQVNSILGSHLVG